MKKLTGVLAIWALTLAISLSVPISSVSAIDDYPYRNHSITDPDPWGFIKRWCTSFVAWRLNHTNQFKFSNDYDRNGTNDFGHASQWKAAALKFGFTVNTTPAVGSVAWQSGGNHVAWVKAVDSTSIVIEEYGYNYDNSYNERRIGKVGYEFIHFKDLSVKHGFTPGVFGKKGTTYEFHLRNSNSSGAANTVFGYGNNSGHHTVVAGDWDGNGTSTVGVISDSGNSLRWFLRNSHQGGAADLTFNYGQKGDTPIVGDWDGNGTVTVGVVRKNGSNWQWRLRNSNTPGEPNVVFNYGDISGRPIAGDWNGNGTWSQGIVYGQSDNRLRWLLRNSLNEGPYQVEFIYGRKSMQPVAGDWDKNGTFTPGAVEKTATNLIWHLRNSNTSGVAEHAFTYGSSVHTPIVGNWDGK